MYKHTSPYDLTLPRNEAVANMTQGVASAFHGETHTIGTHRRNLQPEHISFCHNILLSLYQYIIVVILVFLTE